MIVGIIQARVSSTRLPNKVMLKVLDKTLLEYMIERVTQSKKIDKIIVATTTNNVDDVIEKICKKMNIECFRGSEDDVLLRYKDVAKRIGATTVVRLCGDCPLLDSNIIDMTIESYLHGNYDFVSNLFPSPRTFPDGTSVEVFSSKILYEAEKNSKKPSEREHVTFYMWMQPEKFKIHRVDLKKDLSKFRFNLDYKEDYLLIEKIFQEFYPKNKFFEMKDIILWLDKNPNIFSLNSHIKPQQGWIKSFEKDKISDSDTKY
jgi:spore coat polysaccharide biosynthesis protein SpsF